MVRRRAKVDWVDATCKRRGWQVRYANAGARGRTTDFPRELERLLGPCWIARTDVPAPAVAPRLNHAVHIVKTVVQRGLAPPIHPESENAFLKVAKVDYSSPDRKNGSLIVVTDSGRKVSSEDAISLLREHAQDGLQITNSFDLDSDAEREALKTISRVAPGAAPWILPQGPLGSIAIAGGTTGGIGEKVDFVVAVPGEEPRVVEIDGIQHDQQTSSDNARDDLLRAAGYAPTMRARVSDLNEGADDVLSVLEPAPVRRPGSTMDPLVWGPMQTHRLVMALLDGVTAGFTSGSSWHIEIIDPTQLSLHGIGPYLDLLAAADVIAGGETGLAPETILFSVANKTHRFVRSGDLGYRRNGTSERSQDPDFTVRLECFTTPVADLPPETGGPQIVIRSTGVPVPLKSERFAGQQPSGIAGNGDPDDEAWALTVLLQSVFAKEKFREGQLEAIREVLAGRDCMVLLPTGAGKSIIYQLATICRPGCAVIVDPLVALMDDQVDVMREHGIERVESLSSQQSPDQVRMALDRVQSGEQLFLLVTPERFRSERFRHNVLAMSAQTPVNVAVVDEAHCVSEWGHDFRSAYLDLGRTIRNVCRGITSSPPPILALTGTASRSVLMDVLHQLEISIEDEKTVIKPGSFDREEISLDVVTCKPGQTRAALGGVIRAMPSHFGQAPATFFSSQGLQTASGLVFCATKTGWDWSTEAAYEELSPIVGERVARYSGGLGVAGKQVAKSFKSNDTLVLATTSAYGMGIDKPNIRWIVHNGLPGSIEAYYQQVGRAARDRDPSRCVLLLTEFSRSRNDELMQEDDLDIVKMKFASLSGAKDNVTTALFFHLQSFVGAQTELVAVLELMNLLELSDADDERVIPIPPNEAEEAAQDRGLLRLKTLGLVGDIVRTGNQLKIRLNGSTAEQVVESLVRHVDRSQPGQADGVRKKMSRTYDKLDDAIEACAGELIRFIYATVERSRRRSLREMLLAARAAADGADMRTRVLEYLTEGDVGVELERLLDSRHKSHEPWIKLWDQIATANDARELRAASGRLLESYPNDPFLRSSRALGELLIEDGDVLEAESDIQGAIHAALGDYDLGSQTVSGLLEYLTRRAAQHEREVVVLSAISMAEDLDDTWQALEAMIDAPTANSAVSILLVRRQLEEALRSTDTIIEHLYEVGV